MAKVTRPARNDENAKGPLPKPKSSDESDVLIELIHEFLACFDADPESGRLMLVQKAVSKEILEGLATGFNRFWDKGESFEKAFGGRMRQRRKKWRTRRESFELAVEIIQLQKSGHTFEVSLERVATKRNRSVASLKKAFTETAPEWQGGEKRLRKK